MESLRRLLYIGLLLTLLLPILSRAQEDLSQCGRNIDLVELRITSPFDPDSEPLGTWPWMVSAGTVEGSKWNHFCGGSVISKRFVLTAAHCTGVENTLLRLGDKDLLDGSDDFGANVRRIRRTHIHPKYRRSDNTAYYDVALWEVTPSIVYSGFIRPLCLPPPSNNLDQFAGQQVTVSGWGFTSRNSNDAGMTLKSVPIRIFPQRSCNRTHSTNINAAQEIEINKHLPNLFTDNLLCAGYERPLFGPCQGDSGSPLVKLFDDGPNTRYMLTGIVQGGVGSCGDKKLPAIFVRTTAPEIYDFIKKKTRINPSPIGTSSRPTPSPIISSVSVQTSRPSTSTKDPLLTFAESTFDFLLTRDELEPSQFDKPNDKGETFLTLFANQNSYSSVSQLIERGANINQVTNNGANALMYAAQHNGSESLVKLLMDNGINRFQKNVEGSSAIHYAASVGNLPVLKILVASGLNLRDTTNDRQTALHLAIKAGAHDTVKYILDRGGNINAITKTNREYPIHFVGRGPKGGNVVSLLLRRGANLEVRNKFGVTPLYLTSVIGFLDPAKELLKHGAKLETRNNANETMLHKCAINNFVEMADWLLSQGNGAYKRKYLNDRDHSGETAFNHAAAYGKTAMVRKLFAEGADPNIPDTNGVTPLEWAVRNKHTETAEVVRSLTKKSGLY